VAARIARISLDPPADEEQPRSAAERWQEMLAQPTRAGLMSSLEVSYGWAATAPLPPPHQAVFEAATAPFATATVVYPLPFLDFVQALTRRLLTGGTLFVTDFGTARPTDLEGPREPIPTRYGNTLCHPVSFALFDTFCLQSGLSLIRTRDPLRALHAAAIRHGRPVTPALAQAFRAAHLRDDRSERLVALRTAAGIEAKAGDHKSAARLYRLCLRLDPYDPEIYLRLGETCLDAGLLELAVRQLRRGRRVDLTRQFDFDFPLGRVYFKQARYDQARRAFRRAISQDPHPATYANLGMAYERLGARGRAIRSYRRSLELAPEGDTATTVRRRLCEIYLAPGIRQTGGAT
jgi:Flp pilus assembly protein TadD